MKTCAVLFTVVAVLLLSGCDRGATKFDSEVIHDQIGRYHFVAANGEYPAMIVDTATGCTEALVMTQYDNVNGKVLEKYLVSYGSIGADRSCNFLGKTPASEVSK